MNLIKGDYGEVTLNSVIAEANKDSDIASVSMLCGDERNPKTPEYWEGAVIIIKGGDEALKVLDIFTRAGLLTADKPVVDPPNFKKS